MQTVTISLADSEVDELRKRALAAGFTSNEEYLRDLIRLDTELECIDEALLERIDGPFEPLEENWQEIVRRNAEKRGVRPSSSGIQP